MKITIMIVTLVALSVPVSAQQEWTLRQCIDYAVENNIRVKQQQIQVETSEIELNTSRLGRLPSVSGGIGGSYGIGRSKNPVTESYETINSAGANYSLSASLPVFSGGRINHQIRSSRLNLMAAAEGLKRAKEDIAVNVTSAYMEILFKREVLALARDQLSLTGEQVARTEIMVAEQSVARSQLYDIQAEYARSELAVVNARNDLDMSLLGLAQLLNLDAEGFAISDPQVDDVFAGNPATLVPPREIYAAALDLKPQVREAEYRLANSEQGVRIAQSSLWPSVGLGLSHSNAYHHVFEGSNPSLRTQLKSNRGESIGVNISIPIFNGRQARNQVRTARLALQNQRLELENVKLDLFKEIQQAHQIAVAAQARYGATGKASDAASESYRHVWERYREGMATPYELSEAQNKLLTSRSEQLQAKYEYLFRTKLLDFYRGVEIDL